jgi:hypothetical protein
LDTFISNCKQRNIKRSAMILLCGMTLAIIPGKLQAQSFYSVERLPVEKFDQTPAGRFAQAPWQQMGANAKDVTLLLDANAESPFINNVVHGVGMIINDQNPKAGQGTGMKCDLGNPPPGQMMIDFDFSLGQQQGDLSPMAILTDAQGKQWQIALNHEGNLALMNDKSQWESVLTVEVDQWYHISLIADTTTGKALIGVAQYKKTSDPNYYYKLKFQLGNDRFVKYTATHEMILPTTGSMQQIAFVNTGNDAAIGSWKLDNILMAGDVDSPRAASWAFDMPDSRTLRASKKKAWGYYFPVYTLGWDDSDTGTGFYQRTHANPLGKADEPAPDNPGKIMYRALPRVTMVEKLSPDELIVRALEQEIRLAKQIGLDGYVVDYWANPHPKNGQAYFEKRSLGLLDAALNVDPDFKIVPAVYSSSGNNGISREPGNVEGAVAYANSPELAKALNHPSTYRLDDGRIVLSMWLTERHSVAWWQAVLADLKTKGYNIALFAHFNSTTMLKDFAPISWAMAHWGPRVPSWDYKWVAMVHQLGCIAVSPIASQDYRPSHKTLWEAANSEAFRSQWENAITTGADWGILNTWSDFTEQAQMPATRIGFSFYDLNAYYVTWFKTGKAPAIKRDVLYYFYRRQRSDAKQQLGKTPSFRLQDERNGTNMPKNDIEMVAFLAQPGELVIHVNGQTYTQKAPAGLTSFKAPMAKDGEYVPRFELRRNGKTVIQGKGQYVITDQVVYPDLLYQGGRVNPE